MNNASKVLNKSTLCNDAWYWYIFPDTLGADFYTGTLHKWCYATKGSAILWVDPKHQNWVLPLVKSFGYQLNFQAEFFFQVTWNVIPLLRYPTRGMLGIFSSFAPDVTLIQKQCVSVLQNDIATITENVFCSVLPNSDFPFCTAELYFLKYVKLHHFTLCYKCQTMYICCPLLRGTQKD